MKRALAWLAGIVGLAALGRMVSRRRHHPAENIPSTEPPAEPTVALEQTDPVEQADDPAEELRRKLAAARQEEEPAQPAAEETLDERRARVHAKAREAIEAMNEDGQGA